MFYTTHKYPENAEKIQLLVTFITCIYMHCLVLLEETISIIIMTFRKHQLEFLAYHVAIYIVNFIDPPYVILRFIVI